MENIPESNIIVYVVDEIPTQKLIDKLIDDKGIPFILECVGNKAARMMSIYTDIVELVNGDDD